jgi:hypothetical protein
MRRPSPNALSMPSQRAIFPFIKKIEKQIFSWHLNPTRLSNAAFRGCKKSSTAPCAPTGLHAREA